MSLRVTLPGCSRHRVLVTRPIAKSAIERLDCFFEVECCAADQITTRAGLMARLRHKAGALIGIEDRLDAALVAELAGLVAVCNLSPDYGNLDLDALTLAGIQAMNLPYVSSPRIDVAASELAAENLIAAFGFGRMGGRPPNLLNPELLCNCC